jgi:outer membrane protein assembly factor BamB
MVCLGLLLLGPLLLLPPLAGGRPENVPSHETDLPVTLHLQWVRELPHPRPAWPDQPTMTFDAAPRPVAIANAVVVPSTTTDGVTAYDPDTGEEKWHFSTDGPVRFAPAVSGSRLFVVSDDGYLYCLNTQGDLLWKFRGGPSDRKILGNERLISSWPARGAPAVADGKVYFAAGIWPFMGIFLHCLDARTGTVVWTTDGDGPTYMKQPHQTDSFAGVAPQGTLMVSGDRLLIPGGRSVPACYDRATGKVVHYRLADGSKLGGGSEVQASSDFYLNGGAVFDRATGDYLATVGEPSVLVGDMLYALSRTDLVAYDIKNAVKVEEIDRKGVKAKKSAWKPRQVGSVAMPRFEVLINAGARLYGALAGEVLAIDLPLGDKAAKISWRAKIDGRPRWLVAAEGKLYVSTREGRLYCFGGDEVEPKTHPLPVPEAPSTDEWTEKAAQVLSTSGAQEGYCIAWGVGSGRLIHELVRQSKLRVIAVEPDEEKVDRFRSELTTAGVYGQRVAVLHADPETVELPLYLATLMVSEDLEAAGVRSPSTFTPRAFSSLRPYGGVMCLPLSDEQRPNYVSPVKDGHTEGAKIHEAGPWTLLIREGPLRGSADWTHEHADAANSRVSRDKIVKAPLGVLWFGGPGNEGVLPRHGHGPQPQVIDGRAIIEGVDMMRAVDIYTGRFLWEVKLPGVGKAFDNLSHQPGANSSGSNYVSTHDGIYVAYGDRCLRLDPATGARKSEYPLPPQGKDRVACDYVNVVDDILIAGCNYVAAESRTKPVAVSSSQRLVAMDRHTGKVLWTATATSGFRHNGICAGGGRLYALDRASPDHLAFLQRKTPATSVKPRLIAFDLHSGQEVWKVTADVFGTWLSYSTARDVLVESGRVTRDTLSDEPKGMRAYRGADGKPLWFRKEYVGPAMIHGDTVLLDKRACQLMTGDPVMRTDPLTGQPTEWTWTRNYGCNTPMASENLMTFRSGAAGYLDLCQDCGTANLGGFRSGCTNNLIVADGLLTAIDYTRTCTCSYQNQTSLALLPVADNEMWTSYGDGEVKGPIRRVGINLGAPGDRKTDDGTLWLEHPSVGGPSPRVGVSVVPTNPDWFRRHESQVTSSGPRWLGASGARNLRAVGVTLAKDSKERTYTVRLYFLEPDAVKPGERVFDVALNGRSALHELDIVQEAGGPMRTLMKEFANIRVKNELYIALTPTGEGKLGPILCGVEVVAEGW